MPPEMALEQSTVGSTMGPSGQGGEEPFDDTKSVQILDQVENFQQTVKRMEMSIEELKKQVKEAEESKEVMNFSQEAPQPTKIRVEDKPKNKYDLVDLFSPPRMTSMTGKFGLKGGWSIDDRAEDPVTKRTYDLRNKKDQNEVLRMIRRDKPLVITVSPPCTLFSIANQGPLDKKGLAGAIEMMKFATEVCDLQSREGRYYVFEQSQGSQAC